LKKLRPENIDESKKNEDPIILQKP